MQQSLETRIHQHVTDFWKWALQHYNKDQVLRLEIDSPSFPDWNAVEETLEELFTQSDFDALTDNTLEHILFLIAHQWDIGIVLNWFNKGGEEISQLGMTEFQLQILSERGLTSDLVDARGQLAASLHKVSDEVRAKESYWNTTKMKTNLYEEWP